MTTGNERPANEKERNKYHFLSIMRRVVPIQFSASPWHSALDMLIAVVQGLIFTAVTVATKSLFDVIAGAATGQNNFTDCLMALLLLAGATFGQQILDGVYSFHYGNVNWAKSAGKIRMLLHRKLQRIDPACFEDTDFLDDLNKAREGAPMIMHYCMTPFNLVCFYGVYFASVGAYLFNLKPILLLTLLIAFIPALINEAVRARMFTKLEEENAPLRRENEYLQKTMCDREYFKETRILGAFSYFYNLFSDTLRLLTRKTWRTELKSTLLQFLFSTTSFAGSVVATYLLFTATMEGEISVGAFAAVFNALGNIFHYMHEVVTYHIGRMNKDVGKVANFVRILDMPERTGEDRTPDFSEGVAAENVSFTYPGRDRPAVRDISLNIANGETIAIVGENGAGKSTLVRLLVGVYLPSVGWVTAGGADTAKTASIPLYKGISGVFQKYQRYKMTLEENVTISDIGNAGESLVKTALEAADFNNESVTLDTMLSPEFDGIDLSGGQWQRLAIARGLYRTNRFIVLDEPTAAIDPIEETRVYTQFQRLAEGKCAVVVTHRLGSAKLAHRIIVMDDGKIVDTGTHEELLARPGKYADMWIAQAKWYERA